MNKLVSALHEATHLVPGVPTHGATPATERHHRTRAGRLRNRSARSQNPHRYHQTPPRVLITWQNWIGRHVGHNSHE